MSELEDHLAPIFSEMSLDRLHRAAHEKEFRFQGRPRGVSPEAIQGIALYHLKRRQDEERELRTAARETRTWLRYAVVAVLSAVVGAAITAFFG